MVFETAFHVGGPQISVRACPHGPGAGLCIFQNGPGVSFRLGKSGYRVLKDICQKRTVGCIDNHDTVVHVQDGTGPFPAKFGIQVPCLGVFEGMGVQGCQRLAVDQPDELVAVVNHAAGDSLEIGFVQQVVALVVTQEAVVLPEPEPVVAVEEDLWLAVGDLLQLDLAEETVALPV